jgi:hypothetical protein
MPLAAAGGFSYPPFTDRPREPATEEETPMRYEFERDGTVVASVLWEGPGQVTVDAADSATRATVDRYLSSEVVYLEGGFDVAEPEPADALTTRRRDWTPWEFERACRNLAHRLQAHVRRVETGPVEQREAAAR